MNQNLIAFGIGTRACGGQNLAHLTIRIALVVILKNFDISADPIETNGNTMEMRDAFVSCS